MVMEKISSGAEAEVYSHDGLVVKSRPKKGYRIETLDRSLRAFRTRREVKIMKRLSNSIDVPEVTCYSDGKRIYGDMPDGVDAGDVFIIMSYVDGKKMRDVLSSDNYPGIMREAGRITGKMHSQGVAHGDLTTSNFIYSERIFLIDFGLSVFTDKVEDKAVDIHIFRQALESGHPPIYEDAFKEFLLGYRKGSEDAEKVLERFDKVESRGRYKKKQKR